MTVLKFPTKLRTWPHYMPGRCDNCRRDIQFGDRYWPMIDGTFRCFSCKEPAK